MRPRVICQGIIIVALAVFVFSACAEEGMPTSQISRDSFDGEWPFTVAEGTLDCEGAGAVTFTTDGTSYAVNGLAQSATDYPDVDAIWADDPSSPGLKIFIGDVIQQGLELCE